MCSNVLYFTFIGDEFSLHKVPFIQWTYTGGDISGKTPLSERMVAAGDNLRQSFLYLWF